MKNKKVKTKLKKAKKLVKPKGSFVKFLAKSKTAKLKPKKELGVLTNFKFKPSEKAAMQKLAKQYTKGNLTKWLRAAGLNYRPAK